LDILNQLATFPLGKFLIQNRGLNGYWIDYIINEPKRVADKEALPRMEKFILFESPIMRATQERYRIFQREIQNNVVENAAMASCPSGIMNDFLTLEQPFPERIRLYGFDIDQESLDEAERRVNQLEIPPQCAFLQGDAWQFTLPEPVDFITSNGLNIYVEDDQRVVELYRQFYHVLKPGGVMLTSIITPPSEYKMDVVDPEAARVQRILFDDMLEVTWRNYRSIDLTREQLEGVGFTNITFIHDAASMYPSVLAYRPE
jgi:SAM-dependent methyltransferase